MDLGLHHHRPPAVAGDARPAQRGIHQLVDTLNIVFQLAPRGLVGILDFFRRELLQQCQWCLDGVCHVAHSLTRAQQPLLLALQRFYSLLVIALRPFSRKPPKPVVLLYGHQLSGNLKALYEEWDRAFGDRLTLYYLSLDPGYAAAYVGLGEVEYGKVSYGWTEFPDKALAKALEYGRKAIDFERAEDLVGFIVDPYFLQKSFTIRGHEALKELGESDDMD